MKSINDFLLFLFLVVGGVILELIIKNLYLFFTKKEINQHRFSFLRYLFLLLFPLVATLVIILRTDKKLLLVFFTFSFMGAFIEWLIGFFYHKIVGQRLWRYYHYSLSGYTSWLSLPLWGLAGVLFWLLARIFIY